MDLCTGAEIARNLDGEIVSNARSYLWEKLLRSFQVSVDSRWFFFEGLDFRRGNKERPTSSKGINGFLARNALIKYRRDISARLASPAGI